MEAISDLIHREDAGEDIMASQEKLKLVREDPIVRRFWLKQLDPREAHHHCRFDAPFWPTSRTRILFPLYFDKDERPDENRGDCSWEDYIKNLQELRMRLKDVLSSSSCPDTLEAAWREASCPDNRTYELAIRTGLKHVKIIYKWAVQGRWTNSYLRWVLDVVVLDVYSLVRHCVSYVTKAEKNHSQLQNEITTLKREHAFDDRALMRMLASRKCTFIDTSLPDDRHHCPKPKHDIAALPDGATDLWYPDVFDMYSNRHEDLESTTLAQGRRKLFWGGGAAPPLHPTSDGPALAEFVAVHHQSSNNKPRKKDRIIRYRRFNEHGDDKDQRENLYRGMCTLHVPWRDEQEEILSARAADGGFEGLYKRHESKILQGRARFEAMLGLEGDMEDELQNVVAEDEEEANEAAEATRRQLAGDGKYVFDEAEFMDAGAQDMDVDLPEPRFDQPQGTGYSTL
ncbi:Kinesin-like protein KIN-12F [Frankliniella fusca]|uniref:Kinesin-like protein KIN-12F n=1 Tax=Frankliniella fusca TaxID=407009 RepID=A0AAE1LS02_9NEOP|nr:Kinesin-like protein KIN-12F [Frankliniella fusca]